MAWPFQPVDSPFGGCEMVIPPQIVLTVIAYTFGIYAAIVLGPWPDSALVSHLSH